MATITETTRWRDMSAGIVSKVSSDIAIPNSVPFAMNMDFNNDLGKAVSREGTNRIGNQLSAGNPCLGMHYFRDSVGTNHKLFSAFNGTIFDTVGSTGEVSGLTSTARCHFVTFLDDVLMLNGDQSRSTNGNGSWVTSGGRLNVQGVPSGAQFPEEWHDRLYALVTDRLYYTSTPSTGTVSWGASGSGSIQIEQEDGGGTGTALARDSIGESARIPTYLQRKESEALELRFDLPRRPSELRDTISIECGEGKRQMFLLLRTFGVLRDERRTANKDLKTDTALYRCYSKLLLYEYIRRIR